MSERSRWLRRISGFLRKRIGELDLGAVEDPRSTHGRRWPLKTLLRSTLVGLAAGCTGMKSVELLTTQMSGAARKLLNIRKRLPDTTLRAALCRLKPRQVIALLDKAVMRMKRRKAFRSIGLPFGVASMDGKVTAMMDFDPLYAQLQHNKETGHCYGLLRTVTTCLSSDVSSPCIDVCPVPAKTNEMGIFQKAFAQLREKHDDLFRVVTYDAGAAGRSNADCVVDAGKDYLFHIADDNRLALKMAKLLLGPKSKAVEQSETTVTNTRTVKRKLFLHKIYDWKHHTENRFHQHFWGHTRTVVRVCSETWEGDACIATEDRYFVSSLRQHVLTPTQWLMIIRGHWRVENHCHGVFDKIFKEDDHLWITGDSQGALVVLILRRVVYTLLAAYRSVSLKSDDSRTMPWKTLLSWVHATVVAVNHQHIKGLNRTKASLAWI